MWGKYHIYTTSVWREYCVYTQHPYEENTMSIFAKVYTQHPFVGGNSTSIQRPCEENTMSVFGNIELQHPCEENTGLVFAKVYTYNIFVRKILCYKQSFTVVKSGQQKVNIQICGFVWKVNTPKKVNNTWHLSKASNPNFKVRHICRHQSEVNTQGKASNPIR